MTFLAALRKWMLVGTVFGFCVISGWLGDELVLRRWVLLVELIVDCCLSDAECRPCGVGNFTVARFIASFFLSGP